MKFAYTIVYVPNVPEAMSFYEKAFGFTQRFIHESQCYGEMETGATALAFLSEEMSAQGGIEFEPNRPTHKPAAIELAFTTQDVQLSYDKAIAAGASPIMPPCVKPWGQTISYVRDLNGVLIEICSEMTA
jgi:lactoylglutathione lyase